MSKRVCIAVGGTAGHVKPALCLEEKLQKNNTVHFAGVHLDKNPYFEGQARSVKSVCGANFSKGLFSGLKAIIKGFVESYQFLKKSKIEIVVGFGSFHSLPILLAAKMLRLKLYLYESNIVAGKVNRAFSFFAKKTYVMFDQAQNLFGKKECIGFFLSPRNKRVYDLAQLYKKYDLKENKQTILIFGGSLGSEYINSLAIELVKKLPNQFQCIHLVGKNRSISKVQNAYKKQGITHFVSDYHQNMSEFYAICDIAISRSGANTVAEQIQFQIPSILIPFAQAVQNHQEKNAEFMQNTIRGAKMLLEKEGDVNTVLCYLLDDEWRAKRRKNLTQAHEKLSGLEMNF